MKSALLKPPLIRKADALRAAAASPSPMLREIDDLYAECEQHMRASISSALLIGMRLLWLHRQTGETDAPGGFRAALKSLSDRVAPSTAYRWLNAASNTIAKAQDILAEDGSYDPAEIQLPEPGSKEWSHLEAAISASTKGMSLRRLLIGSSAISDESRLETLITQSEAGDPHATSMLDKVAAGELTLVQAIRAAAGAVATKGKERQDPIYLDIDGTTGQPKGLFPKCMVTLANTFARWETLDEAARGAAKKSWKELVTHLPKELR